MEEELKLLGLNSTEIKLYITLLKIGESPASEIAKKSGIPRSSIYDVLERLEKEGLATHITKNFLKFFTATDPGTIITNLEHTKKKIQDVLPELNKIKNRGVVSPKTEIYTGQKGMQNVLNMILKEKELFVIGASKKTSDVLPFFMESWHKERAKRKIQTKIIYNNTKEIKKDLAKSEYFLQSKSGWHHKFLNMNYLSPVMTVVFGNKVMLGTWKKDEPSAVLIEDKDIAETYKQYILGLWKIAKS